MSALVLCGILIASSPIFALQQVLTQPPAPSPITPYFPAPDYQPSLDRPNLKALMGIHDYEIGGLKPNPDCPNSKTLQDILALLKTLQQDESYATLPNANIGKLNEKLQVLAYLKNYLENAEQQNKPGSSEEESNPNVVANDESPKTHVEAQIILKYAIPSEPGSQYTNTGCQEALTRIIQTINNAQFQLMNVCRRASNCILQEPTTNINFSKLPSTATGILGSIQSMLSQAPIPSKPTSDDNVQSLNDKKQQPKYYLEPTRYDLLPNINPGSIPLPKIDYKSINVKDNKYETLKNFPGFKSQFIKENKPLDDSIDETRHNHFPEELYTKEINNPSSLFSDNPQSNIPVNNYKVNRPSNFDQDIYQSMHSYTSSPEKYGSNENIYNDVSSYNTPLSRFQNQNSMMYTLQKGIKSNFGKEPVNPIINQNSRLESPINKRVKSLLAQKYSVMSKNLHYNFHNNFVNQNSDHRSYMNSYMPPFSDDYLEQGVYDNRLFDSPQMKSVPNLGKLNLAADNNGIVELTYNLRRPQPYQPYYYVKYHLPYDAFVSKILELSKNPEVRQYPARLHEELLSVSNVADTSPVLRTVENSELSKLVLKTGALVNASILGDRSSKTDELLKTVQNLNSKLNTNEILNLVALKPKTASKLREGSTFRDLTTRELEPESPVNLFSGLLSNKNSFAPSTYPRPT